MARLRIRIELNRGGVGVPLHKLASVVDQAQKFFCMLADDVHVDQSQGEWLGFDFDHESLNFTAEFVGPVTPEQVSAFHAAFDGTTSLRRTTIGQFARITEAIGEDELIGFGLYLKDQGDEPAEWRCLSRRDALRISEEMQLLTGGSGELDRDTHLPTITHSSSGARWFSERHERGAEPAKWVTYVREVEANLDRRIGRVEKAIDDQSGLIGDLHSKSTATEDSVRRLLGAVEGFCAQTTRQLEAMSSPALPSQGLGSSLESGLEPGLDPGLEPAPAGAETAAELMTESELEPVHAWRRNWGVSMRWKRDWQLAAGAALLVIGIFSLGLWAWQSLTANNPSGEVAANDVVKRATPAPAAQPITTVQSVQSPAQSPGPSPVRQAGATVAGSRIQMEASELTWVSVRSSDGKTTLARLFSPGEEQSVDLPSGATLRVGNAGGLTVRFNGQAIGPIGTHGQVREVVFRDGAYKIGAAE